jgi:mutual gliding-motility protein MglA
MVLFNYSTRELTAKIVYYGPGLCGKTTNLQYVYDSLPDNVKKGKMLSLATKTDRTLFFDFLPLELGKIRGMKTRVQLYTVPGQVFYNSTRKLVLKGADGVVFVADSQAKMLEANVESYKNLEDNLNEIGIRIEEVPLVMQFNKRDLPNLASVEEMNTQINRHNAPFYEAVATSGIGVEDTLKAITKLVLNNLAAKYRIEGAAAQAEPAQMRRDGDMPVARQEAETTTMPDAVPRSLGAEPRVSPTAPRPPAKTPAAAAARHLPEDLALEALEIEDAEAVGASRGASSRAAREAAPRPPSPVRAPRRPAPELREEVIDLGEDVDLPDLDSAEEPAGDLGDDLLVELEEEPAPLAQRSRGSEGAGARIAAQRGSVRPASPDPEGETEPIDLDDPIDLEEAWETPGESVTSASNDPIDIGTLTPGQDRTIDLPVAATVNGRPVRLSLKVTVRLSR